MKSTEIRSLALCILLSLAPSLSHAQAKKPARERLGIRFGYVQTFQEFEENYGSGNNITIHFSERIARPLFLNFQIGAIQMGEALDPTIAREATNNPTITSEMRILFLNVGLQFVYVEQGPWTWYVGAGGGVYSVSILFDLGVQGVPVSDQHFGVQGNIGALLKLFGDLKLELVGSAYHIRTGGGFLYSTFTDGGSDPWFAEMAVGLSLDLR